MSPKCQNCGAVVTKDYARVFTPNDVDEPRCCPSCPDMIRDFDGTVREARSDRQSARATDDSETEVGA